jgi:hypothetical protein
VWVCARARVRVRVCVWLCVCMSVLGPCLCTGCISLCTRDCGHQTVHYAPMRWGLCTWVCGSVNTWVQGGVIAWVRRCVHGSRVWVGLHRQRRRCGRRCRHPCSVSVGNGIGFGAGVGASSTAGAGIPTRQWHRAPGIVQRCRCRHPLAKVCALASPSSWVCISIGLGARCALAFAAHRRRESERCPRLCQGHHHGLSKAF